MAQVDLHVGTVAGGRVGMTAVRLPAFEDIATVVWAEPDERGWSWVGTSGPIGPPNTGYHEKGALVNEWLCTVSGRPGTWIRL